MKQGSPHRFAWPVIAAWTLAACTSDTSRDVTEPPAQITDAAARYLTDVIGVMKKSSVNRFRIDWPAFEAEVFDSAGAAQNIAQTAPGIQAALRLLEDNHSYYSGLNGVALSAGGCLPQGSLGAPVPPTIAYIRIVQGNPDPQTIRNQVRAADGDAIVAWIVDLRGNRGGNMYPMLAGIGPVLGDGVAGYFIFPDPDRAEVRWSYQNGQVLYDDYVFAQVDTPYVLIHRNPKVAVLIDAETGSSGEAVAVSFMKRPNTRFFGDRTCGQSTGVEPFTMSDGALLGLATAVMADREHTQYPTGLAPDEFVAGRTDPVTRAVAWLLAEGGD